MGSASDNDFLRRHVDWIADGHTWFRAPRPVHDFSAATVVAVAPHMDDEAIGCGGTLRRHADAGARVLTVFLSDGRRGAWDLNQGDLAPDEQIRREEALVHTRRAEATEVAVLLGGAAPVFLDWPDTQLSATADLVAEVASIFGREQPDLVYVPWVVDPHRDHAIAAVVTARALAQLAAVRSARTEVRAYEVWSPLPADLIVDITGVLDVKRAALLAYQSQFVADVPDVMLGLNVYRSILLPGSTAAECFARFDLDDYVAFVDDLLG